MNDHPDIELLHATLSGELSDEQEAIAKDHLDQCPQCCKRLEEIAAGGDEAWSRIAGVLRLEAKSQRSAGETSLSRLYPHDACSGSASPVYPCEYAQSPVDFAISFLEPSDRSDAIGRLGEFEILSVIGFGGMGIVLKGFQTELNRPVAVKVMAPHLATSGAARSRFLREAQATAAIVHPNVMPILSVSEKASLPFLVMPFVACHSLQQRIDSDGALAVVDVLRISLQVAEGLAAAHAQGLVHRDVKPANILLERGVDRAMLTDFGLARAVDDATVTRSGVIAGTPQYMSPEQAKGESVDARSDLFSLGSVIYCMSVGHPPFRGETSYGILRKVTDSDPRPMQPQNANVPEWLDHLTMRLMAKEPAERFGSANEAADVLRQCLAHVQQPAVQSLPTSLRTPMRTAMQTPRRHLLVGLVLLVATLTICSIGVHHLASSPQQSQSSIPATQPLSKQSTGELQQIASPQSAQNVAVETIRWDDELDSQLRSLNDEIDQLMHRVESEL